MKVIYDINITFVHPPIPDRSCDYRATRSCYEPGEPCGYGPTPIAALAHLIEQETDAEEIVQEPSPSRATSNGSSVVERGATEQSCNFEWHSTPQLWVATRPDYDGAPDAGKAGRMGFGKTPSEAEADLIEKEQD